MPVISGGVLTTVNPFATVDTSVPVVIVTSRVPPAALLSTVTETEAAIGLVTVTLLP